MYTTNKETWNNPCTKNMGGLHKDHLGGTEIGGDTDSWTPEVLDYLFQKYPLHSALDFGCGTGTTQLFFERNNIKHIGVDGTDIVKPYHRVPEKLEIFDLTTGAFNFGKYDLVWSTDVFEHIEEQYIENIFNSIINTQPYIIAFAAAPEGWGGYHHVNCKNPDYWIEKTLLYCKEYEYMDAETEFCRNLCPPLQYGRQHSFFNRSGLIFKIKG